MKLIHTRSFALAFGLAIGALPAVVSATNGYFAIGYGQKSKGMGGVSIAFPQDALVGASNPAGMARIGSRMDVGLDLFVPPRRVQAQGDFTLSADNVKSNDNFFPIPGFGMTFETSEDVTYGISFVGNGANSSYKPSENFFELTGTSAPYGPLGVELIQMQILPIWAYKINANHAVGVSPVIGLQVFKAYGLGNFDTPGDPTAGDFNLSSDPDKLTNNGHSWSYGAGLRVGWLGTFLEDDKLSLGLAYATKVYMSRFKQYTGLFAENGDFDIPENYAVGAAYKFTPKLTVAADIQRVNYSDVKSVGNRHPTQSITYECTRPNSGVACTPAQVADGAVTQTPDQALGAENGWGFGWTDQTAYKLGFNYEHSKQWSFRAGLNYGKSPIPDDQLLFSLLAPATTEFFYTAGATYALPGDIGEINFSLVVAPPSGQSCVAPNCRTMFTQQEGQFVAAELKYVAAGVAFAMKF